VPMQTCAQCQTEFRPRRLTAKFCGDRCRKAASRGAAGGVPHAFVSVTGLPPTRSHNGAPDVTLRTPISRASKPLPRGIVPDARWPGRHVSAAPARWLAVGYGQFDQGEGCFAQLPWDDPVSQFVKRPADDPIHEDPSEQFARTIGVACVDDCFSEFLSTIRISYDKSNL
jgi:hypothetical protein